MLKYIWKLFTPKNTEHAALIKHRLSLAYGFLGWNAFILVFYQLMNRDLPTEPVERKAEIIRKLNVTNSDVQLIRVNGTNVVENRTMSATDTEAQGEKLEVPDNEMTQEKLVDINVVHSDN